MKKDSFLIELNNNWLEILVHFVGIAFIIGYQILMMTIWGMPPTEIGLLIFALEVLTFYVNFYFILPLLFVPDKAFTLAFRFSTLVIAHVILRNWISYPPSESIGFLNYLTSQKQMLITFWRLGYVVGIGSIISFFKTRTRLRDEKQKLELEKLAAIAERERIENTLILMQLNFHNMFNGLNYIKSHTEVELPHVAYTVHLFADTLRFSMLDIRNIKKITVTEEIQQIKNILEFHERISERKIFIDFKVSLDDDANVLSIPPSLLATLVDNMIRYAVLHDPVYPAILSIKVQRNCICFESFNYNKRSIIHGNGMGIKGVRSIMEYFYKGHYEFNIKPSKDNYEVYLKIEL
ncbi:MAG: hypothetical protein P0Y49_14050 [Candidatus Pedobacter colombiensis]|uniref:Histidine kinase n=1 Tax=Candidatus Pedobacter colombiensis TaxID=3121371 RepID=A0AAJ5W631_9SPHI|nr:hypothetical protein [Pedobacter sp.]WEK17921.1 MAG: hypothetical protein P0Y49_14050 [Pedobacter sp.]